MALDGELVRQAADKYGWNISFTGSIYALEKKRTVTMDSWIMKTLRPKAALAEMLCPEQRDTITETRRYGLIDLRQEACIFQEVVKVFPLRYDSCRKEVLAAVIDELKRHSPREMYLQLPDEFRGAAEDAHLEQLQSSRSFFPPPRILFEYSLSGIQEVRPSFFVGEPM